MGNTDISVNTLPDANTENTTEHSTIFDDVFRTIAQKMPQLLIPLINEVFHTSYSEKEQKSHLYMDMIVLIEEIADYIIPEDNEIRKGLGEIMGGKILKLRSEELLEQGEARGRLTGLREGRLTGLHEAKIDAIQNMIDLGLTREQILRKYSPEEYDEALRSMSVKA